MCRYFNRILSMIISLSILLLCVSTVFAEEEPVQDSNGGILWSETFEEGVPKFEWKKEKIFPEQQ